MIRAPRTPAAVLRPLAAARAANLLARPSAAILTQRALQLSASSRRSISLVASAPALRRQSLAARSLARSYSAVTTDEPAPVVDFAAVKALATADPFPADKYVIVDVREPAEYAAGHIPHALNVPYKSAPGALGLEPEEFQDTFGFAKPEAEKELVFYCLGGVRSTAAEALAATFGYKNRANYVGSYDDWIKNEGPLEIPEPPAAAAPEPKA